MLSDSEGDLASGKGASAPFPEVGLISAWEERMYRIAGKERHSKAEGGVGRGVEGVSAASRVARKPKPEGRLVSRDDLADRVCELWGAILEMRNPPRDRNFFELGGTSLKGVELMAAVRKEFHVELGLRSLFHAPTIFGMCERIRKMQGSEGSRT